MTLMTRFLSITILLSFSQVLLAKDCHPTFEALQKKMLIQHIDKFPLTYGKDLEVFKIDTVDCNEQGNSQYIIHYIDIVCFDINDPDRELLKCSKVRCHSPARISSVESVDFETASVKSCIKIK